MNYYENKNQWYNKKESDILQNEIKEKKVRNSFMYNPRQEYDWDFADVVVEELIKLDYEAHSDMGISQMRIFTNAPKDVMSEVIDKTWEDYCNE